MRTLFSIVIIVVAAVVANFLFVFVVNLAGMPGALLAGLPSKRSKRRFYFGSIVSALGQSYVYLAYASLVVGWTRLTARREDVVGFLLWPVAFIAVALPVHLNLMRARMEAKELDFATAQVEALHITYLVSLAGFFVLAFAPGVARTGWGWVPFVR